MSRPAKQIIDRLGSAGLSRVLDDLLDQERLVRLANACGIKYRGMRTQSQKRARLLTDLVQKASKQDEVRKAVLRVLDKEATKASQEWSGLGLDERVRRLCDESFLGSDGNVGLHLYLLACTADGTELDGLGTRLAHAHLLRVASNGAPKSPVPSNVSREETRLRRQVQQRERKLGHLETQLVKTRDIQKVTKQDLIQRKGELAESRMLVERLRREVSEAQNAAEVLTGRSGDAASDGNVADLIKTVRRLASEQRKLTHRLETPPDKKQTRIDSSGLRTVTDLARQIDKRLTTEAKQRERQHEALTKRVEELRTQLRARPPAAAVKSAKRIRPRSQASRVGVFIDVQNMYYGARRLKGKLDFDALLKAAVQERRLIKATAYVVESKETDQSQFLDVLQKLSIEVRRKTVQVRADGSRKGDWDMELALDVLDAARGLDVVVLVSGDGDFTSLAKRVKTIGPRVEVLAFPRTTAKSLAQAADSFQPLDRKFMIYSRPSKRAAKRVAAAKKPDPSS
jgi:uncharacterized LabA/DUF88 family protein